MKELTGKNALVTGGVRGIGAAIAHRLAKSGTRFVINYANADAAASAPVDENVANGGRAFAVEADVATLAGIDALFKACEAEFGDAPNPDILINNVVIGRGGGDASLNSGKEELFGVMMATNVKGPHFETQAALPRLRDHSRIASIGSMSGKVGHPLQQAMA